MSLLDRLSKGLGDSIRENRSQVPDSGRGRGRGRGRGARGGRHSDDTRTFGDGERRIIPITVPRRVWPNTWEAEGSGRGRGRGRSRGRGRGFRGRGSSTWSRGRGRSNVYTRLERLPVGAEEPDDDEDHVGSDDDEDNVRSDHDEDYAGEDAPQGFIYPSGRYREDSDDEDLHEGGGGSSPPRARVVMRQVAAPADAQSKAALGNKSKLPPNSERRGPIAGMICLCSTRTHADVIRRGLCGLPRNFLAIVDRITPGTAVFLYNFQTKELHGVYEAQGESGENLDPSAFGGSAKGGSPFSAQFRIRTAKRTLAIQYDTFKDIISYKTSKHFELELTESQVCTLRKIFEKGLAEEHRKERRKARFAPLEPAGEKGATLAEEEPAPSAQDISLDVESFLSGYFLTEDADGNKEEEEEEEECAEIQPGQAELDATAAEEGGDEISVVQDSESLFQHSNAAAVVEHQKPLSRMRPAPLMVLDAGSVSQKPPLTGATPGSAVSRWSLDSGRAQRSPSGPPGRTDVRSPAALSLQGRQIRPRSQPKEDPEADANNATIGAGPEDSGLRRKRSRSVSSGLLVSECGTDDVDFSGPPSNRAPGTSRTVGSQGLSRQGSYGFERAGGSGASHPVRLRPPEHSRVVRGSYTRGPFDRVDQAGDFNDRGRLHRSAPDGGYPSRTSDSRLSPALTDSSLGGSLRKPPPAGAYSDPDSDPDDRDSVDTLRRRRLPPPGRDGDRRTAPSATVLPARRNRDDIQRYGREDEPRRDEHSYDRGGADRGRDRGPLEMSRGSRPEDEDERAFKRQRDSRDEYEGPRRPYSDHRADPGIRRARPDVQEEAPRYREDIPMRRSQSPPHPMATGRRNSPPRRGLNRWSDRRSEERVRHDNVRDIRPSGAPGGRRMGSPGYQEDRDRARPWQYQGGRGRRG